MAADAGQDALAVVSLIVPAVVFILIALALGGGEVENEMADCPS